MQIIENSKVKEKLYIEKLKNGLTVMIIPKKDIQKKYIIWGTHYGSNDSTFIVPGETQITEVPKGVAHFLEHKMFEQENGKNSLDVLTAIGVNANAYTTNDHTAYLFECTDNFYPALDEFMDYVQHPYFTEENVEKEKGIIGQEIGMYDDDPGWQLYMNAMDCMYKENPIKIDIAGTVESISKITPDVLYKCYNTFYNPANMTMVVCGDFEPEKLLEEIKKRLIKKENQGEIKRIYAKEERGINQKEKEVSMELSNPLFLIAYKDNVENKENFVKRHIAIEILLNMIIGKSSELYKRLYEENILLNEPSFDYEFSDEYAHITISGQSRNPRKIYEELTKQVKLYIENGLDNEHFTRIKKKIYGDYAIEYNSVADIARMFLADKMKGINSFDYIEEFNTVTKEYTESILKEVFIEKNEILSIINPK